VIPVASWGAHELLPYGKRPRTGLAGRLKKGFHPFPRKTMKIIAGPPVDLSRYEGRPLSRETLRAATDDIMAAITELLGELRGEEPPKERYDHHLVLEERRRPGAAESAGAAPGDTADGETFEPAVPETARPRTGDAEAAGS
ncbi:MAG TPA: hypothetical protein VIL71_02960, partial [Spirillospora sp.]